jgi:type IV secretory pathway VirB4 component
MLDMATFPVFSSFAALVSPTVNPDTQIGTSEDGVYLGDDRHTGREITIKFSDLPAPHICMVGATGSGKTYALLLLLMRLYVEAKRKVIYLTKKPDPKTKYRAVAEYFAPDGCIVDIGPGKYNINPLQIIFDDTILSATPVEVAAKYDSQKDLFCAFLKEWFQDTYSPNMDSYVDETLDRVYGEKKIDRENAKTWINAPWPTLEDLRNQWLSEEVNLRGKKKSTCQALIDKTAKIRHGGALDYINNPTNVDFSLGFMIIDLSGVPETIRDAMNVMVSGMLANQVTANAEKGLTIAIDEGGAFLREPRLASMILTGLTQWRAQDCQLIFATQQFSDLKKADLAEEFLTNCHTKIVLGAEMDQSAVP